MAGPTAFRTYDFKSAEAAQSWKPFFKKAAASLKANHNVGIVGAYVSPSNPSQIIAVIVYPEGSNPKEVMDSYVASDAFKGDQEGKDLKAELEGVNEVILETIEV